MTPETRKEKYLAKMAGDNTINVPEPITREEQYLYQISQNTGGGGGGGTTSGITQEQADDRYLKLSGGAMTGNIDIGGNNLDNVAGISMYNNGIISGLGEPTNDTDAANKQYVDNSIMNVQAGGSGVPIGTIISLMGTTAPNGYLVCDGTIYDIATYTELSTYFTEQFGSSNYFGGDGETTFAVPDLRGEFLRGSGTNSHENQGNGAEVGVHQDSTWTSYFTPTSNGMQIMYDASFNNLINNYDSTVNKSDGIKAMRNFNQVSATNPSNQDIGGTIRPTNTAILYCIKYN